MLRCHSKIISHVRAFGIYLYRSQTQKTNHQIDPYKKKDTNRHLMSPSEVTWLINDYNRSISFRYSTWAPITETEQLSYRLPHTHLRRSKLSNLQLSPSQGSTRLLIWQPFYFSGYIGKFDKLAITNQGLFHYYGCRVTYQSWKIYLHFMSYCRKRVYIDSMDQYWSELMKVPKPCCTQPSAFTLSLSLSLSIYLSLYLSLYLSIYLYRSRSRSRQIWVHGDIQLRQLARPLWCEGENIACPSFFQTRSW